MTRNILIGLVVFLAIITVIVMVQSTFWGLIVLLASLMTVIRALFFLRSIEHDQRESSGPPRSERYGQSQTIYVSLLDDNGNQLDEAAAAARIRKAELMAGPQDTVIGVKRKV